MKAILLIKYPPSVSLTDEVKNDMDERLRNNPLINDYHVLIIGDSDDSATSVTAEIIYNPNITNEGTQRRH